MILAATVSPLMWVLNCLLLLAIFALFVIVAKYILSLMGVNVPPPVWAIVCVIIVILFLIWIFGGSMPILIGGHA